MISVVHVINPFEPSKGRVMHELRFVEGRSLLEYLGDIFSAQDSMTVSVNGAVFPVEFWGGTILRDGDSVVVSPHLAGGNLLRTLASVAVLATAAVVTQGASLTLGGFTLGFTGLQLGATASMLVSGAIAIGGNLLVGALFAGSSSQKTNSASYDPDGPRSLARSGTVIPKGYGTMHWGGNVIASFTDIEGEDQYINALVCYGFGPARSIAQIQINGKDISTYQNVQVYTRLGTNNQLPMPNFNRVVNGYPQDVQCLAGLPVVVPGTGTQTQILQVDVMFPDGIFVLTSKGNLIPAVVTYQVEYSLSGSNVWQSVLQPLTTSDVVSYNPNGTQINPHAWCAVATDMPPQSGIVHALDNGPHNPGDPWSGTQTVTTYQANGNHSTYQRTFHGEWQPTNPLLNQVLVLTWTDGYVDFTACDRAPLYNRTNIYGLAPGKYDVRVTKYGSARLHDNITFGDNNDANIGQEIWIHSVNEVSLLDLAYPNMILIGVRALATNQLSGSSLNITASITHGLRTLDQNILPSALQAYEEDNPACVAADAMLDDFYGGGDFPGIAAANIDRYINEWIAWADLNDELVDDGNGGSIRRHVFNGVFDSEGSLWDALNAVGRMSRAAIMPLGRDYGVFVDQPDVPVQMFTMGNIVQDSFTESWLQIDDRANQVEIQFADSTRYWKTDNPLVYMDPAIQDSGAIIKNVRLDGKGITIPAQAWHAARFRERNNQFLLRSGSFKCDIDAIACRPGNVAILQHDIPQWGFGGRTLPGSTAAAVLVDREDLPFVSGTSYSLVVLHPALLRFTGTLGGRTALFDGTGAATGTQVTVAGYDGVNRVTRCVITGASGQVWDSPVSSYAAGQVIIQPAAGVSNSIVGNVVQLYDTDVLETRPVTGISTGGAASAGVVLLGTALSQAPEDFSTYFFGPVGTQKLVRITNIKKSSEFRATVEWIDYDPNVYVDATPVIGETSALSTSNPGVTSLQGSETFKTVSGSYVGYAKLSWKLGPDTVGVGIYGYIVGGASTTGTALPKLMARLTNYPTGWEMQLDPGQAYTFIVVGFDAKDAYANIKTAPSVTITAVGIANNLLLGSSFGNGFTYWNLTPRPGDTWVPSFVDDGQAVYTVNGSPITGPWTLMNQTIPSSKWSVGDALIISAYLEDSCLSAAAPNVGLIAMRVSCFDSAGNFLSQAGGAVALSGVTPTLTRGVSTPLVLPAGAASVGVDFLMGGAGTINVPVGSTFTVSHILVEIASPGQTEPSAWADIDVAGHVLDLFLLGKSTGLRTQASTVPTFTGTFSYVAAASTLTPSWTSLAILWPDGALTYVVDSSQPVSGLSTSTLYFAWPYFDVMLGGVRFATPSSPVGSPAILSTSYDAVADAACRQDGRVPLATGGLRMTTAAAGSSGGGGGAGGSAPPGSAPLPPHPGPIGYTP